MFYKCLKVYETFLFGDFNCALNLASIARFTGADSVCNHCRKPILSDIKYLQ